MKRILEVQEIINKRTKDKHNLKVIDVKGNVAHCLCLNCGLHEIINIEEDREVSCSKCERYYYNTNILNFLREQDEFYYKKKAEILRHEAEICEFLALTINTRL